MERGLATCDQSLAILQRRQSFDIGRGHLPGVWPVYALTEAGEVIAIFIGGHDPSIPIRASPPQ